VVLAASRPVERILVAGTGSIGRRHLANLRRLRPAARFALLRDDARRDGFSDDLRAEVFPSLAEALDWRPDLAVVATPSDRHGEILAGLLDAGIGTFIEKPVVILDEDCRRLEALAAGPLPPTQVGCVLRFLPSLRQVRQWLVDRRIGNVVRATLEVGQWLPDWRPAQDYRHSYSASRARGGGVVFDLVHEIDLACWLLGARTLLGAWGGHASSLEIDAEDVALLALRGAAGELISVQLDYVSRRPLRRLLVVGDQGSVSWDLPGRSCALQRPGCDDETGIGFDTGATYVAAMEELLQSIETGSATSLSLREGLCATRLAISANRQIRAEQRP
jgi:predicted dehydrogenase